MASSRSRRLRRTFVYGGALEHEALESVSFLSAGSGTMVKTESVFGPQP